MSFENSNFVLIPSKKSAKYGITTYLMQVETDPKTKKRQFRFMGGKSTLEFMQKCYGNAETIRTPDGTYVIKLPSQSADEFPFSRTEKITEDNWVEIKKQDVQAMWAQSLSCSDINEKSLTPNTLAILGFMKEFSTSDQVVSKFYKNLGLYFPQGGMVTRVDEFVAIAKRLMDSGTGNASKALGADAAGGVKRKAIEAFGDGGADREDEINDQAGPVDQAGNILEVTEEIIAPAGVKQEIIAPAEVKQEIIAPAGVKLASFGEVVVRVQAERNADAAGAYVPVRNEASDALHASRAADAKLNAALAALNAAQVEANAARALVDAIVHPEGSHGNAIIIED